MSDYIQLLFKYIHCCWKFFIFFRYIDLIFNNYNRFYNLKIDDRTPNIINKINLYRFYFINTNHNIEIFKTYLPNVNTLSFKYDNKQYYVDIQEKTINNQEVFLDDISL